MKALEAAAIQALHSGRPISLCSLLPKILGLQQFRSGTDKYPQGSWLCTSSLPQTNRIIIIYTRTHARGHGHTTGQAGKGEELHKENPTIQRHISRSAPPPRAASQPRPPAIRVSVGKARLGSAAPPPLPGQEFSWTWQ